jgi:hypothetical protein
MEFLGPVPGVLGVVNGFHVVIWVQASGGAGFTRPTPEERDYYAGIGKSVPEWQCEYFEFDGLHWPESALAVEIWSGQAKLRSLFAERRTGRSQAELRAELPDLDRFLIKYDLSLTALSFHDALLRAAAEAGVISSSPEFIRPSADSVIPWWQRVLRRAWPKRRVA